MLEHKEKFGHFFRFSTVHIFFNKEVMKKKKNRGTPIVAVYLLRKKKLL